MSSQKGYKQAVNRYDNEVKNNDIATFEDVARMKAQNKSFRHSYPVTSKSNGRPGCITGVGISNIKNNAIAGRMTLYQLEKMV